MSFFEDMERIVHTVGDNALEVLLHYYGVDIKVLQPRVNNKHARVYGSIAGGVAEEVGTILGIIVGDDFFESDSLFSGSLQAGILFTKESVKTGQTLEICSVDGRTRRFRVGNKRSVGSTREIFNQWDIAAIAD